MPETPDLLAVIVEWIKHAVTAAPVGGVAGWATNKWRSHAVETSLRDRLAKLESRQDQYDKDKQESNQQRLSMHAENREDNQHFRKEVKDDIEGLRQEMQTENRRNKLEIRLFVKRVEDRIDKLMDDNRDQFGQLKELMGYNRGTNEKRQ